jgi:hypothetical protein
LCSALMISARPAAVITMVSVGFDIVLLLSV